MKDIRLLNKADTIADIVGDLIREIETLEEELDDVEEQLTNAHNEIKKLNDELNDAKREA